MSADADTNTEREAGQAVTLSRAIDWVVSLALVLTGLVLAVGGFFLYQAADRESVAGLVAEGTLRSDALTDAELVDVTYSLAWWGGTGLLVTGVLLIAAGAVFLTYRGRVRGRQPDDATPDTVTVAVVGAAVTLVVTVVPLSPILGGAVAGYLKRGGRATGAKVGGASGLVASVPFVVLFAFLIGGFAIVTTEAGLGFVAVVGGLGLVVGLVGTVVYTAGLGALGGYLAVRLTEE